MADSNVESSNFQVRTGVVLPGGCYFELDKFGLPAGPNIKHSTEPLCRCANRQDEFLIKYLAIWKSEYSERLHIEKPLATAMCLRRIEEWQLRVPTWLEPIVKEWVDMLKDHCEQ